MATKSTSERAVAVVVDLKRRTDSGQIGLETAEGHAAALAWIGDTERAALERLAFEFAQSSVHGDPWSGYIGARLTFAAFQFARVSDENGVAMALGARTVVHCLVAAIQTLRSAGHTAVYYWACKIAEYALQLPLPNPARGKLMLYYGTLHLDPYFAARTEDWFIIGIDTWWGAARERDPGAAQAPYIGEDGGLPTPAGARARAVELLACASAISTGETRRDALKALVQSLISASLCGEPIDFARVVATCDEALEMLAQYPDPHRTAYVQRIRASCVDAMVSPAAFDDPHPRRRLHDPSERGAPFTSPSTVLAELNGLIYEDPSRAVRFAMEVRSLFDPEVDENFWRGLRIAELRALAATTDWKPNAHDFARGPSKLSEAIEGAHPDQFEQALSKFIVAIHSSSFDSEHIGLALLDTIPLEGTFVARYTESFHWLRAQLHFNLGSGAAIAKRWKQAAQEYCAALRCYLALGLVDATELVLGRLTVTVEELNTTDAGALAASLSEIALFVDRRCRTLARQELTDVGFAALRRAYDDEDPVFICLQWISELVKGRKTRAWLKYPTPIELSAEAQNLLAEIKTLETEIGPVQLSAADESYALDQILVASMLQIPSASGGTEPLDQLRRVRQRFDRLLTEARLNALPALRQSCSADFWKEIEIDASTAVLDVHNFDEPRGSQTLTLLYTSDGVGRLRMLHKNSETGGQLLEVKAPSSQILISQGALYVAMARSALLEPSGFMNLAPEAREIFANGLRRFFVTDDAKILTRLRSDKKRHLCIIPHGAFHVFPFHALGPLDHPLAEYWTITYLPNKAYLERRPLGRRTQLRATAMGVSYIGHPFLSELPTSIAEVHSVASTLRCHAHTSERTTKATVMEALTNNDIVHLSCHGSYSAEAPYLQCLYLHGEGLSSRLFAYEILNLNLEHLDLITLSACETALGSFDEADDLRGIQASLLQAGARTVIDTLWRVNGEVTPLFFGTFYRRLASGASKLDSFRLALEETRQRFPKYSDWAAFRFSGDWR